MVSSGQKIEQIQTALGIDLLLSPEDYLSQLLIRDGVFEAAETDVLTRLLRPGDICIDGGCHLGYYTCLMARLIGPKGWVYAFDANPESCESTLQNVTLNGFKEVEVVQAALGDQRGKTSFYLSTDDQTGLSSLGSIEHYKQVITVPWLRLEDFLKERRLDRVRLLKLDVEGAEEMVLKGLGRFLGDHLIDFILVECYEERLRLLNSSAGRVAGLLLDAGYVCWEYGTANPCGWSTTASVQSRGDCNYLFSSPAVREPIPAISLTKTLLQTQQKAADLQTERENLRGQVAQLQEGIATFRRNLEKSQKDTDWLLDTLKAREQELVQLREYKRQFDVYREAIESSVGWRLLNTWRRLRERWARRGTRRRKLYDSLLQRFRGGS
jgi:FkbM family methyltransferase